MEYTYRHKVGNKSRKTRRCSGGARKNNERSEENLMKKIYILEEKEAQWRLAREKKFLDKLAADRLKENQRMMDVRTQFAAAPTKKDKMKIVRADVRKRATLAKAKKKAEEREQAIKKTREDKFQEKLISLEEKMSKLNDML